MPDPDDPAATLEEAKRIADGLHFACRIPDKKPDFFACGGPAAEAYWDYFTPARILSLLAALDAAQAAIERHTGSFTDRNGVKVCGGCLRDAPCPDREAITRELTGKDAGDAET